MTLKTIVLTGLCMISFSALAGTSQTISETLPVAPNKAKVCCGDSDVNIEYASEKLNSCLNTYQNDKSTIVNVSAPSIVFGTKGIGQDGVISVCVTFTYQVQ